MAVDLAVIVGSFTPLTRNGNEWEGACPFADHAQPLTVINGRWRCAGCGAHDGHEDAVGFLTLAKRCSRAEAEYMLTDPERVWEPSLSKPEPAKRLYGLDVVAERPDAPVLVVDSIDAAQHVADRLTAYVVYNWPGGASRWNGLEPLRGRRVVLWPSQGNVEAFQRLQALLADPNGLACHGKVVRYDPTDTVENPTQAGDTGEALIAWVRARLFELTPMSAATPERPAKPDKPATIAPEPRKPRERTKPRLAAVNGATALQPAPDADPEAAPMSEDFLAGAFADQHGEFWRYVKPWNQWFEWRGDGWYRDESGRVDRLAVELTRQAIHWPEAAQLTPKDKRMVNRRAVAGNVRDLAAHDARIAAGTEQWDGDPMLLGVPGGVIDLRLGKLIESEQDQWITKRAAVAPETGTPTQWLAYLNRSHAGNAEIIAYLQRYAGYCCTGQTGEHALAFLYGTGRNGKGVFLETVSQVLGDYARTASIQTFLEQRNAAHSTELARLHKARLVITEESGAGSRWNESRIKHMTGGGKITAHFMRQDDFEYTPEFKLLVAANHKPSLRSVDVAIQSRIHLVPFEVTIPSDERDPLLLEKLRAEWPQILQWMIEGCLQWQERGLAPPQKVLDATQEYMESEDVLADWITECCDAVGDMDGADGYSNYKRWCDAQGHSPWTRIGWSKAMTERGIETRRSNGRTRFKGVSLKIGV